MNTRSKVKLGIVGCGGVAEQCHIPAALAASDVELVAVADSSPHRLEHIVGTFRLSCLATTSPADLVGRVDAVVLSVPNHLHYAIASEFLNADVHVLCEKPLANTAREGGLLCDLAETRGLTLAVGYMKRFEPNCGLMKRLIEQSFLGELHRFEFEYGSAGGWAPVSNYNLQRELAGGGVLMTNGCHFLDRMLCWFGCPSRVTFGDDADGGVEANCSAVFEFDSGMIGELTLSKTHSLRNRFRLYGARGCLEIADGQHGSVTFLPAGQSGLRHEISEHPGADAHSAAECFRLQMEDFARAIQTGTPPRVTGREAVASLRIIERCYSARTPLRQSWVFDSLPTLNDKHACGSTRAPDADWRNGASDLVSAHAATDSVSDNGSGGSRNNPMLRDPSGTPSSDTHSRTARAVLVTGSTGFVGSRLCEVLHLSTGYRARALIHSSGKASYIARYPLEFAIGDLTDLSSVRRAMEGCSFVVHLARGPNRVMFKGLENALRAAVDAGVQRFVHVSSVAVYGNAPPPSARWETAPARKTGHSYGDIKLQQERLVASYGRRFGLPVVILRPPHIYGPFSYFVDAVGDKLREGTLPIVDGGANICNLVYIDNFIEAVLLSLDRSEAVGETFFITDRERVTWRKCLEDFGGMFGLEVPHAAADQLDPPVKPSTTDSVLRMSRVLLSPEFRSALLDTPAIGVVGRILYSGYTRLPEKRRTYIRMRLQSSWSSPGRAQTGPLRYERDHHLIAAQGRNVVHACDKAERKLGYTAPVGYDKAMAITKAWLQDARVI